MGKTFNVIGLMSGTSLDGLDIASCQFQLIDESWHYEIIQAETVTYATELSEKLSISTTLSGQGLTLLDHQLGTWMGKQVSNFIEKHKLKPRLIASHGHTVYHQPERGFTVQIGNAYKILLATGIPVVYDFRSLDVALGGQGAPLVPVGDKLLFGDFDFCLNLGGISNISYDRDGKRLAFDICPVNIVLNYLAKKCGEDFDKDGQLARQGPVDSKLLESLNSLSYYSEPMPKSLGLEWIQQNIFPLLKGGEHIYNELNTFCHHIALQLSSVILSNKTKSNQRILVTGGGAFNKYLIELIKHYLGDSVYVTIPAPTIVSFKEALVFAFLGMLRWKGERNVLKSVTGANADSCSGIILNNEVYK